jgi:outer membrane protein insertion porin family
MKINTLILLLSGFLPLSINAQTDRDTTLPVVSYDKPADYEIGGIRVTGAEYADANTLIAIS